MNDKHKVRVSKFLSKHLRHAPADIGLKLEDGGWVAVEQFLAAAARHGVPITRDELDEVVDTNDKQRFAFDETGTRIRASQGHSVEVDLQLEPTSPPPVLYHGTTDAVLTLIIRDGLLKMRRQHVHLSLDVATALKVGTRHGQPMILVVDAGKMAADGFVFFVSANGVWLTDHVPPHYLTPHTPDPT